MATTIFSNVSLKNHITAPSFSNVDVYSPANSSYASILQFSIRNLRFASESTPKPQVIITPKHESQIPPVIICAKQTGLEIRTRSGGHDFEGLSYVSRVPFVIIDLINLSEVTVDVEAKTAWIEAGATLGIVYYSIAEKSPVLGFPGGVCPAVGVGGYFSGGGYGLMFRKHSLAADNVIDARIVNVNGRILDKESMGEDLFWAIRGGGGASFSVIVAWKVQLVDVPETVTVFTVDRTPEQNATQLVHRWQDVAPKLDRDLFVGIFLYKVNDAILARIYSLFLGGKVDKLVALMQECFPELGVVKQDCSEMSWIESIKYFSTSPIISPVEQQPLEFLLNRTPPYPVNNVKLKSDYVQSRFQKSGSEASCWYHLQIHTKITNAAEAIIKHIQPRNIPKLSNKLISTSNQDKSERKMRHEIYVVRQSLHPREQHQS